tara:strand:+ start:1369 stop:1557 length:189 start_codon:yes stop_codon:yes gene_type:complete
MLDNPGFIVLLVMTIMSVYTIYQQREKLQEQLNKMDKKNQNLIKNLIVIVALIDVALLIYLF